MKLKDKSRKIIKWLFIALLLIGSYALSYFLNGFYETNKKLLILIFCVACGYVGFFIIYYTAYLITLIVDKIKTKKKILRDKIDYSEELTEVIENNDFVFHYDNEKDLKENVKDLGKILLKMLSKITTNGKAERRYSYLNFTVYEVLEAVNNCEGVLREKVDGILDLPVVKFFKLKDKNIPFITKRLSSIIEKELTGENEEKSNKLWQDIKSIFTKSATKLLKTQIEDSVNYVIRFVGGEAFKLRIENYGNKKGEK